MQLTQFVALKREHLERLANAKGAAGEIAAVGANASLIGRPKGKGLQTLMQALQASGVTIKRSSFDAVLVPSSYGLDFTDPIAVREALPKLVFVEIKTANQPRVKPDFSDFFFALTEGEIAAAEALGDRHRVLLYNKKTEQQVFTSVPEIIARAKSTNWQVSVQLGPILSLKAAEGT